MLSDGKYLHRITTDTVYETSTFVREMKLYYRETGQGYPLLILHGLWGASENWLPVAKLLSDRFRVILPDLRNHGLSPHTTEMAYGDMSHDIAELIDTLNLPVTPFVAGHSMGGKIVMNLLLNKQEIVAKGIVIDIAPKHYIHANHSEHVKRLEFINLTDLSACGTRSEITHLLDSNFPNEAEKQVLLKNIRRTTRGFEWKINAKALCTCLPDLLNWPSDIPESCTKDILFIKAGNSDYLQEQDYQAVRQLFPQAAFVTLPGVSHRLHIEQPELVAQHIRNFLTC